jgi:hypothetical protein
VFDVEVGVVGDVEDHLSDLAARKIREVTRGANRPSSHLGEDREGFEDENLAPDPSTPGGSDGDTTGEADHGREEHRE